MVPETPPADRAAITFRVDHLLEYRDTAAIARILAVCRDLGFVPRAEYVARPHRVPEAERTLPAWVRRDGASW